MKVEGAGRKTEETPQKEAPPKTPQVEIKTDAETNPFLTEEERTAILAGEIQDPEWD